MYTLLVLSMFSKKQNASLHGCLKKQQECSIVKFKRSILLWTDAPCTSQPGSSGQKGQCPPALTEGVSESVSLHRYGRFARLLRLLETTPPDSEQPEIVE